MSESQRLWDEHSYEGPKGAFTVGRMMDFEDFERALSSYNPWITDREPTREDGDENMNVECWAGDRRTVTMKLYDVTGRPWRKIVKPKI